MVPGFVFEVKYKALANNIINTLKNTSRKMYNMLSCDSINIKLFFINFYLRLIMGYSMR